MLPPEHFVVFKILLTPQPEKAFSLFAHLLAQRLQLLDAHTTTLTAPKYFCL
jgi:hypothetical protein